MGCDGGTIPKRHELVKGPKKKAQNDKDADLAARWFYCALSQQPLRPPIVACELGRLYNKDAVIEFLLEKISEKVAVETSAHIRTLKDLTELRLTENTLWQGEHAHSKGGQTPNIPAPRFCCPLIGLEMNGRHRFVFIRGCGCTFSERALKEIKSNACLKCGVTFQDDDVVVLNSSAEEVKQLRERMLERRERAKIERKLKRVKSNGSQSTKALEVEKVGPTEEKVGPTEEKLGTTEEKLAAGSAGEVKNGKMPAGKQGREGKRAVGAEDTKTDKKDAKPCSETYKSLFTSHSSAQKETAHWVTYNPYYN
uniref:Replication termination factor 2 n=1 Tax=Petromyzon marinus TaxID=7757 RepID=S4R564_PETMA